MAEPNGNILLCAYQVGSRMSSARQLQTGGTYQLPPQPQGIQPDLSESFDSWQQNITQAAQMLSEQTGQPALIDKGMVRAYQVFSHTCNQGFASYCSTTCTTFVDTRLQCRQCPHFQCQHEMPLISTHQHAGVQKNGYYHLLHASLQYTAAKSGLVVQKTVTNSHNCCQQCTQCSKPVVHACI